MSDSFKPVFNFTGNLTAQEEIDSLMSTVDDRKDTSKVFRPGDHTMVVKDVVPLRATKSDPSWMSVQLRLAGTGENSHKSISTFVMVPMTSELTYLNQKGEKSIIPFKRLVDTLAALGITLTRENASKTIPLYFSGDGKKLAGRELTATVGYNQAHAKARSLGDSYEVVILSGGEVLRDAAGNDVTFSGETAYRDAEAYAKKAGIAFQAFPEVLSVSPIAGKANASGSW